MQSGRLGGLRLVCSSGAPMAFRRVA